MTGYEAKTGRELMAFGIRGKSSLRIENGAKTLGHGYPFAIWSTIQLRPMIFTVSKIPIVHDY